jgi:ribose/xylose/arabinose/galactoside ABC-type transport system permease subunit
MSEASAVVKKNMMIWKKKGFGTILIFAILFTFFSIASSSFLTLSNILNILLQTSTMIIISMGMTWIVITGGIDLSCGAKMGLCGVVSAMLIKYCGWSVPMGLLVSVLVGGAVGALNGISITKVHIPPQLATIGMSTAMRGLAYIICGGATIFGLPNEFNFIGRGYVGIFPVPVLVAAAVVLIFVLVQNSTKYSVFTYAIGGNINAAHLSGIKTDNHLMSLYTIMGLLTGLAGFIFYFTHSFILSLFPVLLPALASAPLLARKTKRMHNLRHVPNGNSN